MFSSHYNAQVNPEDLIDQLLSEIVADIESSVNLPPTPESINTPGTEKSNYYYMNPDHGRNSNDHQMMIDQSSASTLEESLLKLPVEKSHNSKHRPANKKVITECDSKRRIRTAFTSHQIMTLENEFRNDNYLCRLRRVELARLLALTEKNIKVWFQNRRMKDKKKELNIEAKKIKNVSCNATTECEKKDVMTNQEKQQVITKTVVPVPVNSYIKNHSYSLNNYSSNTGDHQQPQVWNIQNGFNYGLSQNQNHCHSSGNERKFVNNYINYPDCTHNNFQNNYVHYNNFGGYNIQNESANIVKVKERTHDHNSYGSILNEQNYHYNNVDGPIQSNNSDCANTSIDPITEFYLNFPEFDFYFPLFQ